jgi:hypothetical protein
MGGQHAVFPSYMSDMSDMPYMCPLWIPMLLFYSFILNRLTFLQLIEYNY